MLLCRLSLNVASLLRRCSCLFFVSDMVCWDPVIFFAGASRRKRRLGKTSLFSYLCCR